MNIKLAADENGKLLALWGNNYVIMVHTQNLVICLQ